MFTKFLVFLAVAGLILSSSTVARAEGAFTLNSAEAGAIVNRMKNLKAAHVSDAEIATYAFTVDRVEHELAISAPGKSIPKRQITGTVPQTALSFERELLAGNPGDFGPRAGTVSGYVALALAMTQSDRHALTPPFTALERSRDFILTGYEHPGYIFIAKSFPSMVPSPVPRQLDGCMPALAFEFSKPDLRETYFRFHKCS